MSDETPKNLGKDQVKAAPEKGSTEKYEKTKADLKAKDKAKAAAKANKAAAKKSRSHAGSTVSKKAAVIGAVITLAVGCAGGIGISRLLPSGSLSAAGSTTITEDQLGNTVGVVNYNGQRINITAKEAIEATAQLDSAKNDDGTYNAPTADAILSAARNDILKEATEAEGITVSDDDVKTYAESTLGSSDYATIASQYGLSEDATKELLKQSAAVSKLRDKIVGNAQSGMTAPTAPTQPAEGAEDTPTAEYGQYIVNLLGDEWDSSKNTWAKTDGDYYAAMGSETFSADSATYAQAEEAYNVAYQKYTEEYSKVASKWTDYVNGLLCNADISINSLVA